MRHDYCTRSVKNQHAVVRDVDGRHSAGRTDDGRGPVTRPSPPRAAVHRVGDGTPRVPRQHVAGDAASRLVVARRRRRTTAFDRRPTSYDRRTTHDRRLTTRAYNGQPIALSYTTVNTAEGWQTP